MKQADFGNGNDWGMTFLAGISLLNVCLRFWRLPAGLDAWDRIGLATIAAGIVMVWILNFRHRRALRELRSQTDEKTLLLLGAFQRNSALWVYLIAIQAVLLARHH